MAWTSSGSILLTSDWQYTDAIPTGSFLRLKHTQAPNGGLFAIAQAEVDGDGKLSLINSQVITVEKSVTNALEFPIPGCFTERRIAIKKLPRQRTLQEELRRLILPGFLQPTEEEIRIVSRSNWSIEVEVSDFIEPVLSVDFAPIHTKLDAITASIEALQDSSSSPDPTPPASNTKTLTYVSDGDSNGIAYWIGTNYGVEAWTNPHTAGRVICSKSSDSGDFDSIKNLVDRIDNSVGTGNIPNSSIKIDLGPTNRLVVNHYSLKGRSDQYNDNHLKSWRFRGSNDDTTWTVINEQINNTLLPTTWKSIPIVGETIGYRYLDILHTGKTSNNLDYLVLGEFEFYGTLTKV